MVLELAHANSFQKNETILRRENLDKILKRLESKHKLTVIDLIDIFCPRSVCDYESKDNQILYRDVYSHPSVEGARLSASVIRSALNSSRSSKDNL